MPSSSSSALCFHSKKKLEQALHFPERHMHQLQIFCKKTQELNVCFVSPGGFSKYSGFYQPGESWLPLKLIKR